MCIFIMNFKVISSLSLVALSSFNFVIVSSGIVKIFIVECSEYYNPDQYVEMDGIISLFPRGSGYEQTAESKKHKTKQNRKG